MKVNYTSLIKSSLRLTSLGAILGIISISSLSFMRILDYVQRYGIDELFDKWVLLLVLINILIILILMIMVNVLSASSKLNPDVFIYNVRTGLVIIYLLLITYNIIELAGGISLYQIGLPSYIALYLLILILIVVASILMKMRVSGTEEKALYIAGTIIDIISVSMALIFLTYILDIIFMFAPYKVVIPICSAVTLVVYIWISIENIFGRTIGKTSIVALWSTVLRRIVTVVAGAILGSTVLYFDVQAIVDMLNYEWTLTSVNETFHLLLFVSLAILLVTIIIGLVGGIMLIPSYYGVRGISLLIRMNKGESIDLSILGISTTTELHKPIEKPPEAPTITTLTTTQVQPTSTETKTTTTKCQFCGAEIPVNAKFCPYCGAYLATDEGTRLYTEPK